MILGYEKKNLGDVFDFLVNIHFYPIINVCKWLKLIIKQNVIFCEYTEENVLKTLKHKLLTCNQKRIIFLIFYLIYITF